MDELLGLDNLAKPSNGSTATYGNGSLSACAAVVNDRGGLKGLHFHRELIVWHAPSSGGRVVP